MAQNFNTNQSYSPQNPLPSAGTGNQPDPNNPYANQPVDPNYGFIPDYNSQTPPVNDPYGVPPVQQAPAFTQQSYDPNSYNPGYNDINNAPFGVQPTPAQNFEANLGSPNGAFAPNSLDGQNLSIPGQEYYDPAPQPQPYNNASYTVNQEPQPYYSDPNNTPLTGYEAPNTFIEKKSGNKFLMWLAIFVIIVLMTVSGVLFFLSRNRGTTTDTANNVSSSSSTSPQSSVSSSSSQTTSTPAESTETPAQLAKIRNSSTLPGTWLSQKFSNNGVDTLGVCTNTSICGESADPDNDGLTNLDEYNYDSDPQNDDTDADGISDGNEIYIYTTSPRLKDSDRDGVADFAELVACNDPIKMSTAKTEASKLEKFALNTELKPLKQATIKSFNTNGATASDLTKGYLQAPCLATTSSTSAPVSSGAASSSAPVSSGPSISL